MFLKQKSLNCWFWKWHIIAGLITLPVMILLSVTGALYLFKADYNNNIYSDTLFVEAPSNTAKALPYQAQLEKVHQFTDSHVMQVALPETATDATGFRLHAHAKDHSRNVVYVNPYSGEITGQIKQKETLMYTIRKLHGELLLSKTGTLIVETVASWFIVLILTGLYVWWPKKKFSVAGFFTIRTKEGRRIFWRDIHSVFSFWLSVFMLIILAGGMPWTDVFGSQLKWVQTKTDTGYPTHWRSAKGLNPSVDGGTKLSLDEMVSIADQHKLQGAINIKLPMKESGVFTVNNRSFWLRDQQVLHFNRYTGDLIKQHHWADVGILMEIRQIAMRLHQGEYGFANWLAVLFIVLLFTFSTAGALVSYLIRKPKGRWGLPKTPANFSVGWILLTGIMSLAIVFSMFGSTLVAVWLIDKLMQTMQRKKQLVVSASNEYSK